MNSAGVISPWNLSTAAKLKPISTPTIFNPLQGRSCQKTTFLEKNLVSSLEAKTFTWHVQRRKIVLATDNSQSSTEPSISESGNAQIEVNQVPSSPSIVPQDVNFREPYSANSKDPAPRRPSLTMREKLRAARFLSKYMDSKPAKEEFGSRVLEASRASDSGKRRPGLPEAPTNLFDDSKRGLPPQGWTFEFPFQGDIFFIVFSFVFISSVMLATTFIVWKSGAIHFNEY
ncbi:uncharacterized protein LOC122041996 [Zingiber officinale]|uniref:Uncharacterized protein n=1 Tax=Zingiber officinale TaxID=94328 RepID=A0A8J5HJQ7_ZINOF|nr:uncharacterized protein LOC122041996 [Zingiber officinale]KAG6528881.1 hypothetical protein ZIOFF_011073 [Zingiber officinale]